MANLERGPESNPIVEVFRDFFRIIRDVGKTAIKGFFTSDKKK